MHSRVSESKILLLILLSPYSVPLRVHEGVIAYRLGKSPLRGKTWRPSTLVSQLSWGPVLHLHLLSLLNRCFRVYGKSCSASKGWNGVISPTSSSLISFTRLNCWRIPCCTNHRAVTCALSSIDNILSISSGPALLTSWALLAVWSGQNISTCCTVCLCHPHAHLSSIPGIFITVSHPFSPNTSILSRNSADAWCFGISEYNFRVFYVQGVFHIITFLFLAYRRHLLYHSSLAHSSIADFSFCGLPGGTLLALGRCALCGPSLSALSTRCTL